MSFPELTEPPGKDVRCVVSVGMLTEGWDAQNVTQILGLRAFSSQLLCEQVVGRGLRRMSYDVGADGLLVPEYCDVFGIPFEAMPVLGDREKEPQPQPPSHLVMALPERSALRITFPRVDGYTVHVKRHLRCDVKSLKRTFITPKVEPTEVVIGAQPGALASGSVGFGSIAGPPQVADRERYYREHTFQRTAFEIARDVTRALAAGRKYVGVGGEAEPALDPAQQIAHARLLFPQVLDVVKRYLDTRVSSLDGSPLEEVGIELYRQEIIERIIAGIEPDTDMGEEPMLPRVNKERPLGSTDDVLFRTTKAVASTKKSHVSHVVCDSTWEKEAGYHFELADAVIAYVKNDRLGFGIPYEASGALHTYIPDYLVRIRTRSGAERTVVWEIKGLMVHLAHLKEKAARKWCKAVTLAGQWGVWQYVLTDGIGQIRGRLKELLEEAGDPR